MSIAAGAINAPAALRVVVHHAPLKIELFGRGSASPLIVVNGRGLTYFEHRRTKAGSGVGTAEELAAAAAAEAAAPAAKERRVLHWGEDGKAVYEDEAEHAGEGEAPASGDAPAAAADAGEAGLWEESFGTHHDSKPNGPQSVGFDVSFPGATHLYGVPEHASSHALKATDGTEGAAYSAPYRLYNLDVFEYELDNPMALYGSIPFLISSKAGGGSAGIFWNNPTETYIDISKTAPAPSARWISESGVFDLTLFPGRSCVGNQAPFIPLGVAFMQ